MQKRLLAWGAVILFAMASGGCALQPVEQFETAFYESEEDLAIQAQAVERGLSLDDLFEQVSQRVPGFGGMYIQDNRLEVHLLSFDDYDRIKEAIIDHFGRSRVPVGDIRVHIGRYDFSRLKRWQQSLHPLFNIDGIVFTDVNEKINRIVVGVEDLSLIPQVKRELVRLNIPAGAVEFEAAEAVLPMITLREKVRPLIGGLQINFPGFLCTYGFNATRSTTAGFVTNSHCTTKQGGVESTQYWQPSQADDTLVGTETVDPGYTAAKCPATVTGKICRWSDSAFVRITSGVTFSRGYIAKTTSTVDSLTLATGKYRIIGEAPAVLGDVLTKVGRTTGTSKGSVTGTCVDVGLSGTNILFRCQDRVSAKVGAGDSGSPVFKVVNLPLNNDVKLYGILWGGNSSGTTFTYSPIANIQRTEELGTLKNCISTTTITC